MLIWNPERRKCYHENNWYGNLPIMKMWDFQWLVILKMLQLIWRYVNVEKMWMRSNRVLDWLIANAEVTTVLLGSIPASSDTVESERQQLKQCWRKYWKNLKIKTFKRKILTTWLSTTFFLSSFKMEGLCFWLQCRSQWYSIYVELTQARKAFFCW